MYRRVRNVGFRQRYAPGLADLMLKRAIVCLVVVTCSSCLTLAGQKVGSRTGDLSWRNRSRGFVIGYVLDLGAAAATGGPAGIGYALIVMIGGGLMGHSSPLLSVPVPAGAPERIGKVHTYVMTTVPATDCPGQGSATEHLQYAQEYLARFMSCQHGWFQEHRLLCGKAYAAPGSADASCFAPTPCRPHMDSYRDRSVAAGRAGGRTCVAVHLNQVVFHLLQRDMPAAKEALARAQALDPEESVRLATHLNRIDKLGGRPSP